MSLLSSANDVADKGVLVHARDNSDLAWINHRYYDIYAEYNYWLEPISTIHMGPIQCKEAKILLCI